VSLRWFKFGLRNSTSSVVFGEFGPWCLQEMMEVREMGIYPQPLNGGGARPRPLKGADRHTEALARGEVCIRG
jgi:hypothetical protein